MKYSHLLSYISSFKRSGEGSPFLRLYYDGSGDIYVNNNSVVRITNRCDYNETKSLPELVNEFHTKPLKDKIADKKKELVELESELSNYLKEQ